jgi:uncharacterized protein YndB with AHSA1/START domain
MTGLAGVTQAATQHDVAHEAVSQTITIQAEPAKVWALLRNFEGIARWDFSVERSVPVDENQATLSRRVVYKDNAGREEDVLDMRSDADMTLSYHASSASWPVTQYHAVLSVKQGPAPGSSEVEWRGTFDIKSQAVDSSAGSAKESRPGPAVFGLDIETDPDAMPGSKRTDQGKQTVKIISDQYRAGLASLKWVLER